MEEEEDEDGATTASLKHFQVTTSQPGGVTRRLQWDETGEESLHRPEWRECSGRSFHFLCFSATRPPGPARVAAQLEVVRHQTNKSFHNICMLVGAQCFTWRCQVAAKRGRRPLNKCRLHRFPKHLRPTINQVRCVMNNIVIPPPMGTNLTA